MHFHAWILVVLFIVYYRWCPWEPGRQGSGYFKKCLALSKRLRFDAYVLYYPTGSYIDWHTDVVPGAKHWRLNIVLKHAVAGGNCLTSIQGYVRKWWRFTLMRPDITCHSVSTIKVGTRYVLSIGWLT